MFSLTERSPAIVGEFQMNCPKCGKEMTRIEKSTMSGRDMRTYRCDDCREEHIVDYGIALWKAMSDGREAAATRRAKEKSFQEKEAGTTGGGKNKFYLRVGVAAVCLVSMIVLLSSLMR
jgi:transposase-like protein